MACWSGMEAFTVKLGYNDYGYNDYGYNERLRL